MTHGDMVIGNPRLMVGEARVMIKVFRRLPVVGPMIMKTFYQI